MGGPMAGLLGAIPGIGGLLGGNASMDRQKKRELVEEIKDEMREMIQTISDLQVE